LAMAERQSKRIRLMLKINYLSAISVGHKESFGG
jgi:hypothetical protein